MLPEINGSGFSSKLLQAIYDTDGSGMNRKGWKTKMTGYEDMPQGILNRQIQTPAWAGGPLPGKQQDMEQEQIRRASNVLQDNWSYGMGDAFPNMRLARAVRIFNHSPGEIGAALSMAGIEPW